MIRHKAYVLACCLLLGLTGCASRSAITLDPVARAAAEATVIVQYAQATAIVAKARAQATALAEDAVRARVSPTPSTIPTARVEDKADGEVTTQPVTTATMETRATVQPLAVEIVGVSVVPDSGLIQVRFKAQPSISAKWQYWNLYMIDEVTGITYNDIPDAPLIGRLFSRPPTAAQVGYVMFRNTEGKLQKGGVVTVVLGDFKQEHVLVQ
jgi:hypothetical protein